MKSPQIYIISLWFLGILSIPMGMVPSQVMNYLTGMFQKSIGQDGGGLLPVIGLFLFSMLGVAVLGVIQTILKGICLESAVRLNSMRIFDHILRVSPDFFRKNQTAKVSNRIVTEIRKVETFLLSVKAGLPVSVLGLLFFGYVLFCGLDQGTPVIGQFVPDDYRQTGNWFLACLILLLSPLQGIFLLFDKKIQEVRMATAKADDDVADISYETVSGVSEIRNNFAFDYAMFRINKVFTRLKQVETQILKIDSLFSGIDPVIDGIVKCILLAAGARLCLSPVTIPFLDIQIQAIEWKDYLGFAGMAVVVDSYIGNITNFIFRWRMAKESFRRLDEYKKAPAVFKETPDALSIEGKEDDIAFENLSFETENGIRILNNLNFKITPGDHIALVGPSGCGKSTTLNLLVREIRQTLGDLTFAGKRISDCSFASLTREIGLVQQKPILFNMSLRDNILMGVRRNSEQTLLVDGAAVDTTRLENCEDQDHLNRLLISTVKKVGLDKDMIRKGLDNAIAGKFRHTRLVTQIKQHGSLIREQIRKNNPELVQAYHSDAVMLESSLLENLLFGMIKTDDTQGPFPTIKPHNIIFGLLAGTRLLEQLLFLGQQLFIQDRNVAHRIKHHSAKLFDILEAYGNVDHNSQDLIHELGHMESDAAKKLTGLKKEHQQVLLDVALSSNAREAALLFPDGSDFKDHILQLRKTLSSNSKMMRMDIKSFNLDSVLDGISVREILLGGQVNTEIRGAYEQVDTIIAGVLAKNNLTDELIAMGLGSAAGESGRCLSGGQAMKVAIARMVLKNPNILLLDEATAALDEKSQSRIVQLIEEDFKDKTVITISHRLSTIKNYDRILVFDRGQIVQQGTYEDLVSQEGLFLDLVRQEKGEPKPLADTHPVSESLAEPKIAGTEIERAIALNPVFSNLNSEEIALLERMSKTVKCTKDSVLFNRGEDGDEFFIILDGEVEFFVEKDTGGEPETKIIDRSGPGQSFGELALFGNVSRTLGARAKTDARLCILKRDDIIRLIEINPGVAVSLLENVSKRIARIREKMY